MYITRHSYIMILSHLSLSLSLLYNVAQMESTLSEFSDTVPSINKQIYNTYHAHVTNLSRRFFHLLLRYHQQCTCMYSLIHRCSPAFSFMRVGEREPGDEATV